MRVWVTRAQPEARRTAERLVAAGHTPLVSPLLEIHALDAGAALAETLPGVAALAFTSANGVRAFAALSPDRALPVFAVGAATAATAREAGFAGVMSADGDVTALAGRIADARPAGLVLHPGARQPAGDLAGELGLRGVNARALAIYEAQPMAPSGEVLAALDADPPGLDAVLVHSPRAGALLARVLAGRRAALLCVCISQAAAEPLIHSPLKSLTATDAPTEAAMFARLAS